jgi:acyl-CoA thioester hydrolase
VTVESRSGSVVVDRLVEWVDTDASGHHHNAAVLRWFEVAEARLLDRVGLLTEIYGHLPRARVEVDFTRSLDFGQEVEMEAWVCRVGASSVTFAFELRSGGEQAASGRVVAALRDTAGRAREWPQGWREALEGTGDAAA